MKAAILIQPGYFEIKDINRPMIANDSDVLLRIKAVGVCGSDIHYFKTGRIGPQVVKYPFIAGHETAGIVEATGNAVRRLDAGQRVGVDPAISCGECDQCRAGRENTCRQLKFLGAPGQMDGAMCEFIVMPERNCYPVPDTVSFEQATLSEPFAIALYSVERAKLEEGASVAVIGAGPVGMCVFHALRAASIENVFVTEKIERRLALARALKPNWAGNPDRVDVLGEITKEMPLHMDVVFECSGDPEAIQQGVSLLKPGGRLMVVGIPEVDEIGIPIHDLRRKEITIYNIRRQLRCTQKALDLIAASKVNLDSLVTHRFPLEKSQHAFELVSQKADGVMKAIITI